MPRSIAFELSSPVFDANALRAFELTIHEQLGQPYRIDVGLAVPQEQAFSLEQTLGAITKLDMLVDGAAVRSFRGVVAHASDGLDNASGHQLVRLAIVPPAHLLTLVKTQEVYLGLSWPKIIESKLEQAELAYEMRLSGLHPEREFTVQYNETDLQFVSRLCEHVGISWFSEPYEDGERLIFTDDQRFQNLDDTRTNVPFCSRGEAKDVFALRRELTLIPKIYTISDYNYRTPLLDLAASSESPLGAGGGSVEYGSHVKTVAEAQALADVRRQEAECGRVTFHGRCDRPDLGAGVRFSLRDHPQLGDPALLVVSAQHRWQEQLSLGESGDSDVSYHNDFVAIPGDTPYRPARVTPRPRIYGIMSGIVEALPGSDGTRPWLDPQGRYRISLLFDTADHSGKASRAMRMAQQHAGPSYGTHFPLRPGVEVLISFIDGDVDRPIILAAVPNTATPSPVVADEHLRHRVRTSAGVEIEFKDRS